MRFRAAFAAVFVLVLVAGCEESQGGFGKADVKDPGVHVKETKQKPDAPPDFAGAMTMKPAYKDGELVVTVALKPGFHAYAPGEEIGKPVSLVVKEQNGWKLEGAPEIPAGETKDLGELGTSKVLEGTFPVKAKVTGGNGALAGELEIQVCTDNACDRPRKHPFEAPAT
jgi:hypothetical protein